MVGKEGIDVPQGYRPNQKGSEVLPATKPTYWKAGGTAEVGWALSAQHGGGYSYRLCPKNSKITEECFQSNTLSFAKTNSTIHFDDGSHADIKIPTTTYVAPDGTEWRTNPIPGCACDNGIVCGSKEFLGKKAADNHCGGEYLLGTCAGQKPSSSVYQRHGSATSDCPMGTQFEAGFDQFTQGFLTSVYTGKAANKFSVMDEVQVPNKPGEYVLGWRWDCEETDQVWNSCADIVITDGPTPPPAPTPPSPSPTPPSPSPPSKGDYTCWKGSCYLKPGFGTMDKDTCSSTCKPSDSLVV
jgi:hypothetical protein